MDNVLTESIRAKAHNIYVAEGRPTGKAVEHWLAAEQRVAKELFLSTELDREEGEGGIVAEINLGQSH